MRSAAKIQYWSFCFFTRVSRVAIALEGKGVLERYTGQVNDYKRRIARLKVSSRNSVISCRGSPASVFILQSSTKSKENGMHNTNMRVFDLLHLS